MAAPTASSYPATFALDPPERIANWRPLVQWLLAIPHMLVVGVLGYVAELVAFISWLAILFTGKQPDGLAGIQRMYQRYQMRTWAYVGFQLEDYPPFSFSMTDADPGDYAGLRVDFRTAEEGRNRGTVLIRLLMVIPHVIVLSLAWIAGFLAVLAGFFAVLFTGRWPEGLRSFVLGLMRWQLRFNSYFFLLNDEYPPFSTE
jgi:hypothetical protein